MKEISHNLHPYALNSERIFSDGATFPMIITSCIG